MKRILLITTLLALVAQTSWAGKLPEKLGYSIYMRGVRVGHSEIAIDAKPDITTFTSTTKIRLAATVEYEISAVTEVDSKTFYVRSVAFDGLKGERPINADYVLDGVNIEGTAVVDGTAYPRSKVSSVDKHLVLEDYVVDHQVIIALAYAASNTKVLTAGLFFPTSFSVSNATMMYSGDAEVESAYGALIAKKLTIQAGGTDPWILFVDPERRVPVYMVFPTVLVEIFLDDFYKDQPLSRWHNPGAGE